MVLILAHLIWKDGGSDPRTVVNAKTCCVVCYSYCFYYSATNMAPKMSKNHVRFAFCDDSTLANQKTGKQWKTFEGASLEPTNIKLSILKFTLMLTFLHRKLAVTAISRVNIG